MTSSRSPAHRRAAYGLGLNAERVAQFTLMMKGYSLLARRYSVPGGEIDLIMRRGKTIAFIEVKARANLSEARASLTSVKQQRLIHAARFWLSHHPNAMTYTLRMDGLFVAPWHWPRHEENLFEFRF
jgi:putative endonuclease